MVILGIPGIDLSPVFYLLTLIIDVGLLHYVIAFVNLALDYPKDRGVDPFGALDCLYSVII